MSVWLTIPSARTDGGTVRLWKERGYKIAIWRDQADAFSDSLLADDEIIIIDQYPGYALAVNALVKRVLGWDCEADWCVAGGDDTEPDANYLPGEIADQCTAHFGGTFGVMQPTGDRWAGGSIDRICGSPWMGREFCERIYGGNGPLWPEFTHMFEDEHLQCVAKKLGILWQHRDLIHLHKHYFRTIGDLGRDVNYRAATPPHLVQWTSRQHWDESQAIFERLKAGGFSEADNILARSMA